MLCNLHCLKARLRLLCNKYQQHSSLNLVSQQRKLCNIFIFGMEFPVFPKKSMRKEVTVILECTYQWTISLKERASPRTSNEKYGHFVNQYAIPKIKMLCNLHCLKARLRLLCNKYQQHSSLNLVSQQRKLCNIFIFGMEFPVFPKKSMRKEVTVILECTYQWTISLKERASPLWIF